MSNETKSAKEKAAEKKAAEELKNAGNQAETAKPEDTKPEAGQDGNAPGGNKPETAPEDKELGPELLSIDELAGKYRLASWKSAALNRMKGWEPGKRVSETEYKAALAQLANRRIGG